MTFSPRSQTSVGGGIPGVKVADVVSDALAAWTQAYKRRIVQGADTPESIPYPLRLQTLPDWPGRGSTVDTTSDVPLLAVEGMPVGQYPRHAAALVMYTMAAMCVRRPELAMARSEMAFQRAVTLVVTARCHAWAALGRVPPGSDNASLGALRWSTRLKALIVRPAQNPDPDALWRHFLATGPPALAGTQALGAVMYGVGPILFTYGAALLHGVGETYSLHLIEREIIAHMTSNLGRSTMAILGLSGRQSLETMAAAATSGYRASVIAHVATDAVFVTKAQMLIYPDDQEALAARLHAIELNQGSTTFSEATRAPLTTHAGMRHGREDDEVSVADTEVCEVLEPCTPSDNVNRYFESMSDPATPRATTPTPAPMVAQDIAAIREAAQRFQEEAPLAPSAIMNTMEQESVHF